MENTPIPKPMSTNKDIFSVPFYRRSSFRQEVFLVISLFVVLGILMYGYNKGFFHRQVVHPGLPTGYHTSVVAQGQYPSLLPKALILYPNIQPIRGEVTTPLGGATQVVTVFAVGDSPLFAFNKYVTYLERNLWTKVAQNIQPTLLYAKYTKGIEKIEVTVSKVQEGSQVSSQVQINYTSGKDSKITK